MFFFCPKDKLSPFVMKYSAFSSIYILVLLYVSYLCGILYKLGKYENWMIMFILIGLEFVKYYFYKNEKLYNDGKQKRKKFKYEKLWKSFFFLMQVLILIFLISVLLGAPFLSNFEPTFMFSCTLTVLAILPVSLYLEINDVFQLIDLASQPPKDTLYNMTLLQFHLTLFGAWLGAVPIPLDWNYEWQVWPNSCILGTFSGFILANVLTYLMQTTNDIFGARKNIKFKNIL